jgi:UTP--glucose-1-phosphate uridylyltransferase
MLPLVDRPLIHYTVEEAISSGIEQIIMVTSLNKRAIEDYFDRSPELEYVLAEKGETELLREMRRISDMVNICYVRQKEQLGLGHAVLTAKEVVGNEPFALILPDDIIDSQVPALQQLLQVYENYGGAGVIAVEPVPREAINKYGIIAPEPVAGRVYRIDDLVEKPEPEESPSDLGVVGRYVLTPEIFAAIEATGPGTGGEIQITDALRILLGRQPLYACRFEGTRYDTGTPLGWIKACIAYAVRHPEIGPDLTKYLRDIC